MKAIKKILAFMLMFMSCISMMTMHTFAASSSQDGLEVTLITDKGKYSQYEQIIVTLMVTNTNEVAVTNVFLENVIPEGYKLIDASEMIRQVNSLGVGETITLTVTYVTDTRSGENSEEDIGNEDDSDSSSIDNNGDISENGQDEINANSTMVITSPQTGDDTNTVAWTALLVLAGIGIFMMIVLKIKIGKRLLSLLLSIAIIGMSIVDMSIEVNAVEDKSSIHIETSVAIDDTELNIQAIVTYDVPSDISIDDIAPGIELDVSSFEYYESKDENYYIVSKVLDTISGTAIGVKNINSIKYEIKTYTGDILQEGTIEVSESWSADGVGFGYGYNTLTITSDLVDGSKIIKEYVIVNEEIENVKNLGIDIEKDSDSDQIPDYLEELLGLNPLSYDTDGDGLPDNIEIFVPEISPMFVDADGDGVNDGDEDSDSDGLINFEEYKLGTGLSNSDTDGDGLLDGEEVLVYHTNPLVADTDGDGLSDAKEIEIRSDPLIAETSFDYIASYTIDVKKAMPTLEFTELTSEQVNNFYISEVHTGLLADENIPGYIDSAFSFSEIGEFGEAMLTFELEPELFDEEFEPAIYWFNEQTQLLEKVDNQVISGNTVSATVSHFSKYIVLNSLKFSKVWEYTLLYDENATETFKGIDVVFVLDSSGSMSWNDPYDNRKAVTKGFIDNLTENDLAAVIDFDDWANVYAGFTNDMEVLYAAVDRIDSSGGTDLSAGISAAINLFRDEYYESTSRLKYIIMLTDGDGFYDTLYTTQAKEDGIVIYTIGLGDSISINVLTAMAEGTGGSYYYADNADALNGIFELIAEESDLAKDSDNDGISDYHEKEMANGNLRLGNGVSLTGINYLVADTDGDGLLDGEEIIIKKIGNIVFAFLKSNPVLGDTDEDGINDKDDSYPLVPDKGNVLLYQSAKNELEDEYGNKAEDLEYNDKDYGMLLDVSAMLWPAYITPEPLMWAEFNSLLWVATSAADDDVKAAVYEMKDHFKRGMGGTYSNSALTSAVRNHRNMVGTVNDVIKFVTAKLSSNGANLSELDYNQNPDTVKEYRGTVDWAALNCFDDTFNGLAIAIHDFWGYNVTITNFEKTDTNYSGILHFHYYDHFGLDSTDFSETEFQTAFGYGFIDWYTLQHYKKFNGAYVPFLTYVDFNVEFSGTY